MAVGYVYLMTNGKDYKIGLTGSEPKDRMKQLQTGSSEKISLTAYTICRDMNTLEAELHTLFSSRRKAGEWFALSEDNLHHIYSVFKQQSINIDMSFIPKAVSKDVDKLMRIDGKRLARGENTLHDKKYTHILDYKNIVLEYMHEEVKDIERKCKEREEALRNEWEEEKRLNELIKEDAKRIFNGEKPLHTFEYKELEDWKDELDNFIYDLTWKEEEKEETEKATKLLEELEEKNKRTILSKEEENRRLKLIEEKKAEESLWKHEANTAEYRAKQAERKAGTVRTVNSWKKYLTETEKQLFQEEELDLSISKVERESVR